MTTTNTTNTSNYYDLIARGVGYINRPRIVSFGKGRNAQQQFAITINAIHGEKESVEYTQFEMLAKTDQAKAVIDYVSKQVDAKKVFASFECGDLKPESYPIKNKEGKEEIRFKIKARLLKISSLWIDGEAIDLNAIYHVEPSVTPLPAQQDAQPNLAQQRQAA